MPSAATDQPWSPTAAGGGLGGAAEGGVCPPPLRAAAGAEARPGRALRCVGGAAWESPQRGGRGLHLPGWEGAARPCPRVGAALASPQVRAARGGGGAAPDGGPGRAGPLRGRLLAGAGLRRGGAGGAAGRRVRRRVLLRPAHLRGRHRHLPQPGLVGVLVRGQPGGAARGAAGRRGAVGAQGPRGHAAAAAGERLQSPPHRRARPRPPRRAGAAARRERPRPPRRARQDLLKTQLLTLLPPKVGEMLQIVEGDSRLKTVGFSHCGITSASIEDSP